MIPRIARNSHDVRAGLTCLHVPQTMLRLSMVVNSSPISYFNGSLATSIQIPVFVSFEPGIQLETSEVQAKNKKLFQQRKSLKHKA